MEGTSCGLRHITQEFSWEDWGNLRLTCQDSRSSGLNPEPSLVCELPSVSFGVMEFKEVKVSVGDKATGSWSWQLPSLRSLDFVGIHLVFLAWRLGRRAALLLAFTKLRRECLQRVSCPRLSSLNLLPSFLRRILCRNCIDGRRN